MRAVAREVLPVEMTGDAVQYAVNRTAKGWVVEVVNNQGVSKRGDQPAVVDPRARARVTLQPRIPCQAARSWKSSQTFPSPGRVDIEMGPGAVEYVEFDQSVP